MNVKHQCFLAGFFSFHTKQFDMKHESVCPDLDPSCLQRLSADDMSHSKHEKS